MTDRPNPRIGDISGLEQLLRPLARMINRQVKAKTPARKLCADLDGKIVAVRVRNTALAMYFVIDEDGISLKLDTDRDADVAITGSLLSLAGLVTQGSKSALRDGSIDFAGDVYTAQAFQELLAYGRPDLEEELSAILGDTAAQGIGDVARSFGRWAEGARETMRQNLSEYLQEESLAVPSRYEVDEFRRKVNALRDDVDRLEARLGRLARRDNA